MKEIPLTKGRMAIVDDQDFEWLSTYKWYFNSQKGYAATPKKMQDGTTKTISMQREIMNTPAGMETDHINGNKLDNRRENLRVATHTQNQSNRGKQKNNTSGFKGVILLNGKWYRQIKYKWKNYHGGPFNTPEEAAADYDRAALELHGEFSNTNLGGSHG
jgi:hypothetical protein